MITGDAVLTACHVASEVGLVNATKVLVLEKETEDRKTLVWRHDGKPDLAFHCHEMAKLAGSSYLLLLLTFYLFI
jgi:magnesium-transporting ATPase (P-type)